MEFNYNRSNTELLNVMKSKAEKKNIKLKSDKNKIELSLESGKFTTSEDAIPVSFKGTINDEDNCSIKGRFVYGFYLYTLVIVSALLIIARFSWSAYKGQAANMILCGIVTALLVIVVVVVHVKSKSAKSIITDFMNNLNIK